jgi:adenylate cyclase
VAIDFEAEGLLKGTRGRAREERLALLGELEEQGVPLDDMRRAVEEDRLALLPVERILMGDGDLHTPAEIAEKVGLDRDVLARQRQALGLPVADPDQRVLTDNDVRAAESVKAFLDAGLPIEGMLEISRVMGVAMSQLAAANRSLIAELALEGASSEREVGMRLAYAARELGPYLGPVLQYAFNAHLLEQVRQDVIGRAEISAGRTQGTQEVSVCFADAVGFTSLGEILDPDALGAVTGRLTELASDVAKAPVRLVKMIGDAALLVSQDGDALLAAAIDLVEAAQSEGGDFPLLRAGVARGDALPRGGDWYGRPVNLASRITGVAYPGSVLGDERAHDAAGPGYRWSFAGARRLKGIDGEVKLFRCRRDDAPEDD